MGDKTVVDFDYRGTVSSAGLSGEAKLLIYTDGLTLDGLFDRVSVAYADINSIAQDNHAIRVETSGGTIVISQLGQTCDWFYRDLTEAFNKKVLSAFHVTGEPVLETKGQYAYGVLQGEATISVFPDCLCILSPNLRARRVPFALVNGVKKENYRLTITLSADEVYTFSMLGTDLDPLERAITDQIRKLRDNDAAFARKLIPSLGFSDIAKAGSLLREGMVVQLKQLPAVLAKALDNKARNSKMGPEYEQLKTICDHERLAVGIKSVPDEEIETLKQAFIEKLGVNAGESVQSNAETGSEAKTNVVVDGAVELTPEQEDALRWIVWAAIPSMDGRTAVVEFSIPGEDTATYLFRADPEWDRFLMLLNRGIEATRMRRELFSLPDEALMEEANSEQRMLKMRTPVVQELRKRFIGRVIHRSEKSWKKSLINKLGARHDT
jgi:hypothetical protein